MDPQTSFWIQRASEILKFCNPRPVIIVDLDYTIWPLIAHDATVGPYAFSAEEFEIELEIQRQASAAVEADLPVHLADASTIPHFDATSMLLSDSLDLSDTESLHDGEVSIPTSHMIHPNIPPLDVFHSQPMSLNLSLTDIHNSTNGTPRDEDHSHNITGSPFTLRINTSDPHNFISPTTPRYQTPRVLSARTPTEPMNCTSVLSHHLITGNLNPPVIHEAIPLPPTFDSPQTSRRTIQDVDSSSFTDRIHCICSNTRTPITVPLYPQCREVLVWCHEQDLTLSICSRSPSKIPMKSMLQAFGIWDLFLHPQIFAARKSRHLRELGEVLNLPYQSFLLFDDDAANTESVRYCDVRFQLIDSQNGLDWKTFVAGLENFLRLQQEAAVTDATNTMTTSSDSRVSESSTTASP